MRAGQVQFGVKQTALRDEHIQVVGESAFVPQIGQVQGRSEGFDLLGLRGFLPPHVHSIDEQLLRVREGLARQEDDLHCRVPVNVAPVVPVRVTSR